MNLADRRMCAEFAGWIAVNNDRQSDALEGYAPQDAQCCRAEFVPHYESDPSAAASLLPKLMLAWPKDEPGMMGEEFRCGMFCCSVWSAMRKGNDAEVCRLVVEAVRKCKESQP